MANGTATWIAAITGLAVAVLGIVAVPFRFLHTRIRRVEVKQQSLEVDIVDRLARIETSLNDRPCIAGSIRRKET